MKRWMIGLGLVLLLFALENGALAESGVEPNVLVLPQGPGSLGGVGENVRPNLNMGLMSYQAKVIVPKGRGSATPDPSITYSSSAGSGIVGIGWSFSAGSSVERGTVRGLPTYTNKDIFFSGGELVKVPDGPFYRARMEGGFKRYRWVQKNATDQQGYWIVEGPDGSKSYYGANEKGELDLDAHVYGTQGTFRWHLTTYVDRNGNKIRYTYFKEGTQVYPDQIAWVFDDNDKPLYHLKFGYEDRPDHISDGKPGFDLQTTKRLKEVQITSNGQRFRSYHFDFEESTGLSRLIKITRYGRDPQKAYPIQFTMKYSDAVFSPQNSKMVTMPTSLGVDFRTNNLDFVDINGDGLPDVVDTSSAKHTFFMNELKLDKDMKQTSHDYPQSLMVQNPTETSAQLKNPSVQMLDYNGDGFTDLVDAVNKKVYVNKGDGKWTDSSTSLQNFPVTGKDPNMRFMDYDGDKKIDVISSDGSTTTFWLNDGKGNWTVQPGKVNIGLGFQKDRLKLIDINGDGLQDVVHITKSSLRYRKYLGVGNWTEWINVKVNGLDKYELNINAQFNDMNGDGMADMVGFFGNKIVYFVNKNGTEFTDGVELQTFKGIDIPDSTKTTVRIVDINGNGSRDIVWIDSSGKVVYLELFGKRPNLMTTISNGIGQRINVDYGSSVYFYLRDKTCDTSADKACAGPWQNKMPMAFTVVTKISTWASHSDKPLQQATPTDTERPQVQSIFYHHGFYDGVEKKFRGFRHVETVFDGDPAMGARKDEIKFDVGDTDTYMHGKQLETISSDGAGKIYRNTTMTWGDCKVELGGTDPMSLDPPIRSICLKAQEQELIEGKPNEARTLRQEFEYDGFGNQTMSVNLGEKDKSGDEQVTKSTYILPSEPNKLNSLWLLRYAEKMEYCDSKAATRCAQVRHFYDGEAYKGLDAGQLRKGNLTRVQVLTTAGKDDFVNTKRRKFDRWGNPVGSQDALGNLRTYTWDDVFHLFPTTETIQLKGYTLEMKTKWDYAQSRVIESTDVNGQTKRYTYDMFGRLVETYQPGDPDGKPSVRHSFELKAPISRIITQTRTEKGKDFDQKSIQCFDGLGRKFSTLMQVDASKYVVYGHQEFTREGQPARSWKDYQQADDTCRFAAPKEVLATSFFYDGLRRKVKTTYEDGTEATKIYSPLKIEIFDTEDNKKDSPHANTPITQLLDGLSRVVEEHKMPAKDKKIVTKFQHSNVFVGGGSRLVKVTFADGSEKLHEYDLRGNVLKVSDPDRSEKVYTYTDNNQVASSTDARGIKLVYTYDALDRILTRQQDGKPETKVTYTYDQLSPDFKDATFLKGRLVSISFSGGRYFYSYNERGMRVLVRQQLLGVDLDFQYTYNNANLLVQLQYPNGHKNEYKYDMAGRLLGVAGKITSLTYDDQARISAWKLANGVETTYAFDKRNRITKIDVGAGKGFAMEYTYDQMGNFMQWKQTHADSTFAHKYSYDALYRLTKAELLDGKEVMDYKQDDLHNITAKSSSLADKSSAHVGDYSYDKKKIHAATKAGNTELAYDNAGYTTKRGKHSFVWDELGRRVETKVDGNTVQKSWYDHSTNRLIKQEGERHTFYMDGDMELREGAFLIYTKLANDRVVGTWTVKGVDKFFDDVADGKADGQITAADAWVYHGAKNKLVTATLKDRPVDLNLTRDMLASSAMRLLLEDKEVNHYYHADHLGSIRAVSDSKGDVLLRKHYYPYGAVRAHTGATQIFSHGFQGTEFDQASGTNAFLLRALDPRLGRWLSPDPDFEQIGSKDDEFNSYGTLMNNPIRLRDFKGNFSADWDNLAFRAIVMFSAMIVSGALVVGAFKMQSRYFKKQRENLEAGLALRRMYDTPERRHMPEVRKHEAEKAKKKSLDTEFDRTVGSQIDKVAKKSDVEASSMLAKHEKSQRKAKAMIAADDGIAFAKSRRDKGRFMGSSPFHEGVDTKKVLTFQQTTGSGETHGRKRSRTRSGKSTKTKTRARRKSTP